MGFKRTHRAVLATVSGLFAATAAMATGILAWTDAHSVWAEPRDARSVCQTGVLTADDAATGDLLGNSAAIGDDYAFLGALSGDTDTVYNCGTVYVFRRDGVSWVQQEELNASDAAFLDDFGNSVSIAGDLLVVGAPRGEIPGTTDIGAVYVFKRTGQNWTEQAQLVAGQFYREQGARFGEAVALDAEPPSGARLIVGASDRTVDFKKTGEVYFFEHQGTDVWETMGFAHAATTGDNDKFGSVVGISGDWAIVGAPKTDDECPLNNTCDSGSAFIFRYTGEFWAVHQKLTGSNTAEGDQFGTSVAIHKNTVVVGAKDAHGGFMDLIDRAGAVYVFHRTDPNATPSDLSDNVWEEEQRLVNEGDVTAGATDDFGQSVAIKGNTIIVGDNRHDANRGEAYLFRHNGTEWLLEDALPADDAAALFYGWSVATNGEHVIAGALGTNSASGSAYTFSIADCNGYGEPDGCDIHVDFGGPCVGAIFPDGPCEEDVNGNGVPDSCECLSVADCPDDGLDCTDDQCVDGECAYIADQGQCAIAGKCIPDGQANPANVCQECRFADNPYDWSSVPGEPVCDDGLYCNGEDFCDGGVCQDGDDPCPGQACDEAADICSGDCDANGILDGCDVDCGPPGGVCDVAGCGQGEDCNANGLPDECDLGEAQERAKLTASDAVANHNFGKSVSVSGDVAVIGAVYDHDGGFYSGSAYAYRYNGSSWIEQAKLTASDAAAYDYFGHSVSVSGDVAVIGAYGDRIDSGSVYVYRYNDSSWIEEAKLTASDAAAGDYFGYSVTFSGDVAVIGAHYDDDGGTNSGSAYVYRYSGSSWIEEAKLTASDAAEYVHFGSSVSVSGDMAVIGAHWDNDGGSRSGAAYVYRYNGSSWIEEAKLTASDAAEYDYFGSSVSVSG
ncbi:MAG: FG-GAP repeat protein, partial [Planctomycetota bacterium]